MTTAAAAVNSLAARKLGRSPTSLSKPSFKPATPPLRTLTASKCRLYLVRKQPKKARLRTVLRATGLAACGTAQDDGPGKEPFASQHAVRFPPRHLDPGGVRRWLLDAEGVFAVIFLQRRRRNDARPLYKSPSEGRTCRADSFLPPPLSAQLPGVGFLVAALSHLYSLAPFTFDNSKAYFNSIRMSRAS